MGDLLQMTAEDFEKVRNLGRKSMEEVINKLIELDVEHLGCEGRKASR